MNQESSNKQDTSKNDELMFGWHISEELNTLQGNNKRHQLNQDSQNTSETHLSPGQKNKLEQKQWMKKIFQAIKISDIYGVNDLFDELKTKDFSLYKRNQDKLFMHGLSHFHKDNKDIMDRIYQEIDITELYDGFKFSQKLIELLNDDKSESAIYLFDKLTTDYKQQSYRYLQAKHKTRNRKYAIPNSSDDFDLFNESHNKEQLEKEKLSHLENFLSTCWEWSYRLLHTRSDSFIESADKLRSHITNKISAPDSHIFNNIKNDFGNKIGFDRAVITNIADELFNHISLNTLSKYKKLVEDISKNKKLGKLFQNSLRNKFIDINSYKRYDRAKKTYDLFIGVGLLADKNKDFARIWKDIWHQYKQELGNFYAKIIKEADNKLFKKSTWVKETIKTIPANNNIKTISFSSYSNLSNQQKQKKDDFLEKYLTNRILGMSSLSKEFKDDPLQDEYLNFLGNETTSTQRIKYNSKILKQLGLSLPDMLRYASSTANASVPQYHGINDRTQNECSKPFICPSSPLKILCYLGLHQEIEKIFKTSKGKESIFKALSDDPLTLIGLCQNASFSKVIHIIDECPKLISWRDKNNNHIGNYLITFSRDLESINQVKRIFKRFDYNEKNDSGYSAMNLLKTSLYTKSEDVNLSMEKINKLFLKKQIQSHQKENHIKKSSKHRTRRM